MTTGENDKKSKKLNEGPSPSPDVCRQIRTVKTNPYNMLEGSAIFEEISLSSDRSNSRIWGDNVSWQSHLGPLKSEII